MLIKLDWVGTTTVRIAEIPNSEACFKAELQAFNKWNVFHIQKNERIRIVKEANDFIVASQACLEFLSRQERTHV